MTDTRELVELIRTALNFCNAAAGEGLEIDGMSPEEFLMRYSDATGFTDWDRIGDHAADALTALSEQVRVLEDQVECKELRISDLEQDLQTTADALARAALAGGRR